MDVSLDGSTGGYANRIEVLEDRSGRSFEARRSGGGSRRKAWCPVRRSPVSRAGTWWLRFRCALLRRETR